MTTIADLGWTPEYAASVRGMFELLGWAEDWDDLDMAVYDDLEVELQEENES